MPSARITTLRRSRSKHLQLWPGWSWVFCEDQQRSGQLPRTDPVAIRGCFLTDRQRGLPIGEGDPVTGPPSEVKSTRRWFAPPFLLFRLFFRQFEAWERQRARCQGGRGPFSRRRLRAKSGFSFIPTERNRPLLASKGVPFHPTFRDTDKPIASRQQRPPCHHSLMQYDFTLISGEIENNQHRSATAHM